MFGCTHDPSAAPSPAMMEPLESRLLLAGEPWGAFPRLIGMDDLAAAHPGINGSGYAVAIIDTGVDYRHPALGGGFGPGKKVIAGWDFVDNDADPMDDDGHGTGLAGIVAANEFVFQGSRYSGIAPGANIIALRVDDGSPVEHDGRIEEALQWVLANRTLYNIVAVNLSIGEGAYTSSISLQPYGDELSALAAAGVVIAASSGNSGVQSPAVIDYPAAHPAVHAVGSVTSSDIIATHTSRNSLLAILAPGQNVVMPYYDPVNDRHIYLTGTGTSFASPYIAGAAAILKQVDPTLTGGEIMEILTSTGSPNLDGDNESGPTTGRTFPRLDIAAAVAHLLPPPPPGPAEPRGTYTSVAFDSGGVAHVAWYDPATKSLKYARSTGGAWSNIQVIDSGPDSGRYVSLALDKNGRPAVAYYAGGGKDLRYAWFDGTRFRVETVDSAGVTGEYPSLAFNAANRPAISYYDRTRGDLRLAISSKGKWLLRTIESKGNTGLYSSLALNPTTRRWSIAYFDKTAGAVKFTAQASATKWTLASVQKLSKGTSTISLAYTKSNLPAISYDDLTLADLRYASSNGKKWTVRTIASSGAQGRYSTLLFHPASGQGSIIYYNQSSQSVMRAQGGGKSWSLGTLASGGGTYAAAAINPSGNIVYIYRTASGVLREGRV